MFFSKLKLPNKKASAAKPVTENTGKKVVADFRAVRVVCAKDVACEGVLKLQTRVFLCSEAPWLPLADCDCAQLCRCHYQHFPDRRLGLRRESDHGLPERARDYERRLQDDRRYTAPSEPEESLLG